MQAQRSLVKVLARLDEAIDGLVYRPAAWSVSWRWRWQVWDPD